MAGQRRTVEATTWPIIGMTLEETANALRVNQRTIQDLLSAGKFPGRKVGNGWRISPQAVEAWLSVYENVQPFAEMVDIEERTPDGKIAFQRIYRYEDAREENRATVWDENPKFAKVRQEMEEAKAKK